jgi:radical SAM protein with 4Fe4S-binding SPASM domain
MSEAHNIGNQCGDCDCGALPLDAWPALIRAPIIYYLELTPACNNRCLGCGNVFIEDFTTRRFRAHLPPPLDQDGWRTVLEHIAPYAQSIRLTGGEPTLHPDFATIARAIGDLGIRFSVFTNGRWHDPVRLINLLSSVRHFAGLLISLHGPDAPSHETFTGVPGSFAETVTNMRRAAQAGLPVTTSTIITRRNYRQGEQIAHLSQSLGAYRAVFSRYLVSHSLPDMEPSAAELRQAIQSVERLIAADQPVGYGPCIPQCFVASSAGACGAGEVFCTIDPWGNVRPCNHTGLVCGNLLAQQPIEAIYTGQEMLGWREMSPQGCQGCAAFEHCRAGCRAMALATGLGHDPLMDASSISRHSSPESMCIR